MPLFTVYPKSGHSRFDHPASGSWARGLESDSFVLCIKPGRIEVTLCPIAIVVGCKKCPAFTVCPVKGVIGDYKKEEQKQPENQPGKAKRNAK